MPLGLRVSRSQGHMVEIVAKTERLGFEGVVGDIF